MTRPFHDMLVTQLPKLRPYALMMTGNRAAADDLLQETALKVLRAESQFEPGTNFNAWTYRILRNEFISSCRRAKRTPRDIDAVPEEFLARPATQEDKIATREVFQAMRQLPETQREVLSLVCGSGMSYEDAADVLDCSVGTVKSRLWRARSKMKDLLLGEEPTATALGAARENHAKRNIPVAKQDRYRVSSG